MHDLEPCIAIHLNNVYWQVVTQYDKFRLTSRRWLIIYDLAGINGNELVGPFNVEYDMKRNSKTYCRLLNQYLIKNPKILPFAKLRFPIVRQYKAPSHASKYTIRWLVHQEVLGKHIWPNLQIIPPESY